MKHKKHHKTVETRGRTLDHAAGLYDILSPVMTFWQEHKYFKEVMRLFEIEPGDRILDIGCGTGVLQEKVGKILEAEKGGEIIGIDAAAAMIEVARKKRGSDTAKFDVAVAENLPYADNSFDKACSLFFFHHVDYELKVKAVAEIKRVLKPGGAFIVVDVDKPSNWFGNICILSGELLFRQPEIKENRIGLLPKSFADGGFADCERLNRWSGYISLYKMEK